MNASSMRESTRCPLVEAAKTGDKMLQMVFGGQGSHNGKVLSELRLLVNTFTPFLQDLTRLAISSIERLIKLADPLGQQLEHGFDLGLWLRDPEATPDKAYLATAPISFPIIGILSLARYCVLCRSLGLHPGEMRDLSVGATGHSQGILIAAVVACADTWPAFFDAAERALEMLFWIGYESHLVSPGYDSFAMPSDSNDSDGGPISSMLSVRGLNRQLMDDILDEANSHFPTNNVAFLALVNSPDAFTISGPPRTLHGIRVLLRGKGAAQGLDQTKVPYPERRPEIYYQFLPVSAAFHSPYLDDSINKVISKLRPGIFVRNALGASLYHTCTGQDIRHSSEEELAPILVRMVMSQMVDWPSALRQSDVTHILDFGPGYSSGLMEHHINGSGVQLIQVFEQNKIASILQCMERQNAASLPVPTPDWGSLYGPRLQRMGNGTVQLTTHMTDLLGVPPIMVAGMTPTTACSELVSTVINSGYHIELAGGSFSRSRDFETAIREVAGSIPPEQGVTCNLIYASPRSMAWQIPLIKSLISEGVNIQGLTIGAGVPSLDVATEYIESLGLKHISFKPNSSRAIHQVLAIAASKPSFPVCLQWTGGQAGGHHSFEDLHDSILDTYASIRNHPNIILVVGGGFGRAPEILPYLTGEWSQSLGFAKMPVDGVLLGSRMMVAKEARTSPQAKRLIVSTSGTSTSTWHHTYKGDAGGVVSVRSELGEPIHKLATRAVMLWRDLDESIFSIKDKEKRLAKLQLDKATIISRLNSDFAKPWFAMNPRGESVELEDMTYIQVLGRLIHLMYPPKYGRWIDESYQNLVIDFMTRIYQRFGSPTTIHIAQSPDPSTWTIDCSQQYPSAASDLLYPDDVLFFLDICNRSGQKPVNFIPRLDQNFETWFKKDSLWQMENVDAVIDQDPQRVCIIHGPVAAQYSRTIDESAAEILDGITEDLVEALRFTTAIGQDSSVNHSIPVLGPNQLIELPGVHLEQSRDRNVYRVRLDCWKGNVEMLLRRVFADRKVWARQCLTAEEVLQGSRLVLNPIQSCFRPVSGDILTLTFNSNTSWLESLTLFTKLHYDEIQPVIHLSSTNGEDIKMTLSAPEIGEVHPTKIDFTFQIMRKMRGYAVRETTEEREEKIRHFFAQRWSLLPLPSPKMPLNSVFTGRKFVIKSHHVQDFSRLIARSQNNQFVRPVAKRTVPLDLCILVAWDALMRPLVSSNIGGDLLRLLHRSNTFEYADGATPLELGDEIETSSSITAVILLSQGKLVEVSAWIKRKGHLVVKVVSSFQIQGNALKGEQGYRISHESDIEVLIDSPKLEALMKSRPWINWQEESKDILNQRFVVHLKSRMEFSQTPGLNALHVTGQLAPIKNGKIGLGIVNFKSPCCSTNPVLDFFTKYGRSRPVKHALDRAGMLHKGTWKVRIPDSGLLYSCLSTDHNPIHTSPVFAGLAGLPGPIVHGMWTSAVIRNMIEERIASADSARFRRWSTSFEDIVRANDTLRIEVQHSAMREGRMVVKIRAHNDELNSKVLEAEAEIEQPLTAYMFCGQGSQQKSMGMGLYSTNSAAQSIWDRSDRFLYNLYGFSLLDIVRNDPKELTIHFSGQRGQQLKENYLALTRIVIRAGQEEVVSVLEGLTPSSTSYTFRDNRGLLFSTQFAQPALTIMEVAEMEALRSQGLVQRHAMFAGHSLGEYAALAACTNIMTLEGMLSLVFYRGLVMQVAMQRDEAGQTDFSMVAANPSRIGSRFTQNSFEEVVKHIVTTTQLLLEVVNYNIHQQQYVCAGHLLPLWVLGQVCDELSQYDQPETIGFEEILELVQKHTLVAQSLPGRVKLERGIATIPLQGIDVPFHSTYLRGGIDAYRRILKDKIRERDIVPEQLIGKFIPNVVGKPISTTREYLQEVVNITDSAPLRKLIASMS